MKPSLVYVASPYSDPDWRVRESRYFAVSKYCATKLRQGIPVFSPIVYSHQFADSVGTDFQSWEFLNTPMLRAASEMHILMLDGYSSSKGISAEIAMAEDLNIPYTYIVW